MAADFDAAGRTVLTAEYGGQIRRWNGLLWRTADELEAEACAIVGAGLSPDEWKRSAGGVPYRRACE